MMKRSVLPLVALAVLMGAAPGAATQPTASPPQPNATLVTSLGRLPKDLWPVSNETTARTTARLTWVKNNFPKGGMSYIGTLRNVRVGGGRGAAGRSSVHLVVELDKLDVWGEHIGVSVAADITSLNTDVAAKWEAGERVGVAGVGTIVNTGQNQFSIEIKESTISSMPVKVVAKATTKPANAGGKYQSFSDLVADIPENLWPAKDESTLHRQAREKWVVDNVLNGHFGTWGFSGEIKDVRQERQQGRMVVVVELMPEVMTIEGESKSVVWVASTTNSTDEALGWKAGAKVSGKGIASIPDPGGLYGSKGSVYIRVEGVKVEVAK